MTIKSALADLEWKLNYRESMGKNWIGCIIDTLPPKLREVVVSDHDFRVFGDCSIPLTPEISLFVSKYDCENYSLSISVYYLEDLITFLKEWNITKIDITQLKETYEKKLTYYKNLIDQFPKGNNATT